MEIIVADKNKLIEVLYILRECSRQLIEKGVKYWNNSQADFNAISDDIANQYVYLLMNNRVPIGTITIKPDKKNSKTSIISRMAIFPHFQKRGLAREILKFAENLAKEKGSTVLIGSTPFDDKSLTQLLVANGFINHGVENDIHDEFVRIKFEKKIG